MIESERQGRRVFPHLKLADLAKGAVFDETLDGEEVWRGTKNVSGPLFYMFILLRSRTGVEPTVLVRGEDEAGRPGELDELLSLGEGRDERLLDKDCKPKEAGELCQPLCG